MTEEFNGHQAAEETTSAVRLGQQAETGGGRKNAGNTRPQFNPYLYENLLCHVECQIESWNRSAVREPSPESAHALWLKAEGLGYALRLLYAFGPEFRDLIDSARNSNAGGSTGI